jgi:hypothetical protein
MKTFGVHFEGFMARFNRGLNRRAKVTKTMLEPITHVLAGRNSIRGNSEIPKAPLFDANEQRQERAKTRTSKDKKGLFWPVWKSVARDAGR